MKGSCRFDIREVRTSDRKKSRDIDGHKGEEASALLDALDPDAWVVAMDNRGSEWSTTDLADKLARQSQRASRFQFMIGGPDGLAQSCLDRADACWSLSRLTFPHFLVRVLLAEQIYRAFMVNANHPYHR